MTTQQYREASTHFLAQARAELADGDLAQGSEKGWGATTQMLRAIAEGSGWEHHHHRHLHQIASRHRAAVGDGDIRRMFDAASALHKNFYENYMDADEVAERLDDVATLLDNLSSA